MTITLHLPDGLNARLGEMAARRHTTKEALVVEAARRFLLEEVSDMAGHRQV